MLPFVVADLPLDERVDALLAGRVTLLPWDSTENGEVTGIYTFGHPPLDGAMMDRFPNLRVISNYGVGVDHIRVEDASIRGIPVGNTPDILNGATADMAFTLLLATARRLREGAIYAHGPDFLHYHPGFMLGREVHGATIGIVGMGRIGIEIAKRARGFSMQILYHNRREKPDLASEVNAAYVSMADLLQQADFVVLACPLTAETTGLIGAKELRMMKRTATLINIARGAVVDTDALTAALASRQIYAAGLDVTEPEPLPRDHPLLQLDNVTIAPHLGSATEQTRQAMSELSVENLLCGLKGEPLKAQVNAL
jgi:glyoxylate reductase